MRWPLHDKMLALFASQGITFAAEHIDPHFENDNSPNRKPGIGMVLEYLEDIPQPGTSLLLSGYPIDIVQTKGNLVHTLRVHNMKRRPIVEPD